ncbi:hypothetical protein [Exiguobacterium sp. s102]|uniref:hypothetical protein n=1 Tax=Exiguobacterium sp. s102 TaxID=2751212 RepID=UPI001BED1C54|nr:hypothetical protein [Exiguobacterium sp. s102]
MTPLNNATFNEIVGKAVRLEGNSLLDDLEITDEEKAEAFLEVYMILDNANDTKELLELHRRLDVKHEAFQKDLESYGINSVGLAKTREFHKSDLGKIELALEYTGDFARRS